MVTVAGTGTTPPANTGNGSALSKPHGSVDMKPSGMGGEPKSVPSGMRGAVPQPGGQSNALAGVDPFPSPNTMGLWPGQVPAQPPGTSGALLAAQHQAHAGWVMETAGTGSAPRLLGQQAVIPPAVPLTRQVSGSQAQTQVQGRGSAQIMGGTNQRAGTSGQPVAQSGMKPGIGGTWTTPTAWSTQALPAALWPAAPQFTLQPGQHMARQGPVATLPMGAAAVIGMGTGAVLTGLPSFSYPASPVQPLGQQLATGGTPGPTPSTSSQNLAALGQFPGSLPS